MTEFEAVVFQEHNVWKARCPQPFCRGGEHHGIQETGLGPVLGGLGLTQYACIQGTCKGVFPARWPDPEMKAGILRLLGMRPDWANRNWLPHETLADLMFENAEHGIGIPELEPGGTLAIVGNRVTAGALTAGVPAIGDR